MIKRIMRGHKYFVFGDLVTVIAVKKEDSENYAHVVYRFENGTRDYLETSAFRKVAEKHRCGVSRR